jgi:hypothetical protein
MIGLSVLVTAILAGLGMLWITVNRNRVEERKAYQPVTISTDDIRRGRRWRR